MRRRKKSEDEPSSLFGEEPKLSAAEE